MPAVFCYRHTIEQNEIDGQGHVNNLVYLKWMQEAAIGHSSAQGWPSHRYRELGAGWVVRTHTIDYLQPAFADQQIEVLTWVASFKKIRSERRYKIVRSEDRQVLAKAATLWAFIDLDNRQPCRIPRELVESFQLVSEDAAP
ncbi:MAG: acyl-CoA thioesterase [Pirellulales bacterium]